MESRERKLVPHFIKAGGLYKGRTPRRGWGGYLGRAAGRTARHGVKCIVTGRLLYDRPRLNTDKSLDRGRFPGSEISQPGPTPFQR